MFPVKWGEPDPFAYNYFSLLPQIYRFIFEDQPHFLHFLHFLQDSKPGHDTNIY